MAQVVEEKHGEMETVRDTVESIWVAIVAAFVLRAFLFEAFVIPTGSMAPRLMGEHWDLACPSCGYDYAHGAPKDVQGLYPPTDAVCPNCRFPYGQRGGEDYVNAGDRVLVLKYVYHFRQPQPWDVVVFKNPQDNRQNYIKRLIGLPGETIEIVHGDIFYKTEGQPWQIRRKPPEAQQVMWQVIYDNDYRPEEPWMAKDLLPRWQAAGAGREHWDLSGDYGRRLHFDGGDQRAEAFFGPAPVKDDLQPKELATLQDLARQRHREVFYPRYGYNSPRQEGYSRSLDICTDLKLEATFVPAGPSARVSLQMTHFGDSVVAEVGADGTIKLSRQSSQADEGWQEAGRLDRPLASGQGAQVALAYADFRATLWVNDKPVLQHDDPGGEQAKERLIARLTPPAGARNPSPEDREAYILRTMPTPQLSLAGQGGAFDLWHVRVMRDVYYTSPDLLQDPEPGPGGDYARAQEVHANMKGWGTTGNPITLRVCPQDHELDEFFVLGDNSPLSQDSRLWVQAAPTLRLHEKLGSQVWSYQLGTVPRYNMIGKAFFVYWPSGFRIARLPLIPNVGRMRLIR